MVIPKPARMIVANDVGRGLQAPTGTACAADTHLADPRGGEGWPAPPAETTTKTIKDKTIKKNRLSPFVSRSPWRIFSGKRSITTAGIIKQPGVVWSGPRPLAAAPAEQPAAPALEPPEKVAPGGLR